MTPRQFGSKQPTKSALKQALTSLLIMRDRLDNVDRASLARSYGVTEAEVGAMVQAEQTRRTE